MKWLVRQWKTKDKYHILVYFDSEIFSKNALKFLSQIIHMDKRKLWHGNTFEKLIFAKKQGNGKIFHGQNKLVYGIGM